MTQNQFQDHAGEADDPSRLFDAYMEKPVRVAALKAALEYGKSKLLAYNAEQQEKLNTIHL
jgi:hypothetical protein